jgi:hypothetical protein
LTSGANRSDVQKAVEDIQLRTLAHMPRALDRFVYLASMRDYDSGLYHHDGLADQFSQEAACEALADCHREAYNELISCSLQDLVGQIEAYVKSGNTRPRDFITAWKDLEPYRVAVPVPVNSFSAEFLFSNLRIALAIVEERLTSPRRSRQAA